MILFTSALYTSLYASKTVARLSLKGRVGLHSIVASADANETLPALALNSSMLNVANAGNIVRMPRAAVATGSSLSRVFCMIEAPTKCWTSSAIFSSRLFSIHRLYRSVTPSSTATAYPLISILATVSSASVVIPSERATVNLSRASDRHCWIASWALTFSDSITASILPRNAFSSKGISRMRSCTDVKTRKSGWSTPLCTSRSASPRRIWTCRVVSVWMLSVSSATQSCSAVAIARSVLRLNSSLE
mmetsp:Transcript_32071/g.76166  ORF Transcript_32071/g.76166 Transcript_32071/m.76166 type:complete len:247 (+) Transcript_32071:143-883(+)